MIDQTTPNGADEDGRSDLEQMVEARKDAVERGEGGPPDELEGVGGEGGAGGVVKNQEGNDQ
ncbi:hypothetical protein [Sphingomonas endolithica]|uniref:hypothetical protein n=1 Tax=Sphingomonas endolithica TaxID=2972485 RepID=UPI0021AECD11|nr:hypothetical protein [Sphingomonas sp. ZFBP2030]